MTIHKLSAGDGYTYLTKHVANADAPEGRVQDAADYYTAKGAPPGRWTGKLTALVGVKHDQVVTESHMRSVFGAARKPDAFDTKPPAAAGSSALAAWSESTALGRGFSKTERSGYVLDVEQACVQYQHTNGDYPTPQVKEGIKFRLAEQTLQAHHGPNGDVLADAEIRKWIKDQYDATRASVAGYDLVFTPAKSVSVLWALGDDQLRRSVAVAHDQAVTETLAWIEQEIAYTRRGAGGTEVIKADGLLIARFDHWDNRAGDPNLHTHCAVANRVHARNRWTTIDGRVFYRAAVAASERYNSRIADILSRDLGVSFSPRPGTAVGKQPVYEINGVPVALLDEFSRRANIEERMAELADEYVAANGKDPSKKLQYVIAQRATLDTRKGKKAPQTLGELRAEWADRAANVLPQLNGRSAVADVADITDTRPQFSADLLPALGREVADTLSRKQGTWTAWTVNAEIQRRLREYRFDRETGLTEASQQVSELVIRDWCIPVFASHRGAPERLADRIDDGRQRLHITDPARMSYTSQQVINAETYMRMRAGEASELTVKHRVIDRAVSELERTTGHCLGVDQAALVEHFLTAGTHVAVGVGAAGTGKTTAMKVVARAWERSHGAVIALGPSARAAEVLGEEIGVAGRTIDDVLTRAQHGLDTGISPGDLLLVDEAGMASARKLADLTKIAARQGAVVRLLGDPQQLPSIESSGILRDLAERTQAPMLSTVHRFSTEGEAAASLRLRAGDVAVLDWYADQQRIQEAMKHQLPQLVFEAYVADVANGNLALMIAPTNDLVTDLNARAAAFYRADGTVTGAEVPLADGLAGAAGDIVVTRRNTSKYAVENKDGKRSGRVKNGDLWTILATYSDGSLFVENRSSGGRAQLPADYVGSDVQLGYASTLHRSQGMTVGTAHILVDATMTRQSLYVGLTRGKHANTVYAANDELPDFDEEHTSVPHPGSHGILARILARDGAQRTAVEQLAAERARAHSLPAAREMYLHAIAALYSDLTSDLIATSAGERALARYLASPAWDKLVRAVTQSETFGWNTATLLAAAIDDSGDAEAACSRLSEATKELPRRRRDGQASRLALPSVSAAAAAFDPIVAAWAGEQIAHVEGHISGYLEDAQRRQSPWLQACGEPGTDVRARESWNRFVTEIVSARLSTGYTGDDPVAALPEARRPVIAERLNRVAVPAGAAATSSSVLRVELRAAENKWRAAAEVSYRTREALERARSRHDADIAFLHESAHHDTSDGQGAHAAKLAQAQATAHADIARLSAAAERAVRDYEQAGRELAALDEQAERAGIRRRGNNPLHTSTPSQHPSTHHRDLPDAGPAPGHGNEPDL